VSKIVAQNFSLKRGPPKMGHNPRFPGNEPWGKLIQTGSRRENSERKSSQGKKGPDNPHKGVTILRKSLPGFRPSRKCPVE